MPIASTPRCADQPGFWEREETVAQFASREPDQRLRALASLYPDPSRIRVLDLGCAGGRNAVYLATRGFDVTAIDASLAMTGETSRRLAGVLGAVEASRRVRRGGMDHLEPWSSGSIDLVVALGILQSASCRDEWNRSLAEMRRVLARGGLSLVANFTPAFRPAVGDLVPVPGEPHCFDGMAAGRSTLFDADELDREFLHQGFSPLRPTETVFREVEGGRRVTANALYIRV